MKRLALLVLALSVTSGAANAADMPLKAAPMVAPFSWTGFYVGGNIGYGWGDGRTEVNPLPTAATFVNLLPQTVDPKPRGILGGVQAGYNLQMGRWVFGVETDFQGADISGTFVEAPIIQNNGTPFPGAGNNLTVSQKLDWFGTLRARAGVTVIDPRLLLYVTGGLAYGHVIDHASVNFRPAGTTQYIADISSTKAGWTAGAGGEWAFANGWSLKAEYLHIDLGSVSSTVNAIPPLPPFQVNYNNIKTVEDIVRVGVNLKLH